MFLSSTVRGSLAIASRACFLDVGSGGFVGSTVSFGRLFEVAEDGWGVKCKGANTRDGMH